MCLVVSFSLLIVNNLNKKNTSNVCIKLLNPGDLRCFLPEGDGNCFFSGVSFSLTTLKQQNDAGIDIEANISVYQLRILAIAELRKQLKLFRIFQTVSREAENFLQQGYFHSPLRNTMLLLFNSPQPFSTPLSMFH